MVDVLLASLLDAIRAQSDLRTGNTDLKDVNEASARFIKALNSLIDQRVNSNIEERKKFRSQEKTQEKAKESIRPITVLNSAPPPLEEIDLDDPDYVREWFKQYKHWYETKRKAALTSG
jgi:hypothetical protein